MSRAEPVIRLVFHPYCRHPSDGGVHQTDGLGQNQLRDLPIYFSSHYFIFSTLFASAAGIFLTLAYARLRISTIVNSGYSRLARTPQGGPRFFYDWHVDVVVPVSGVQRIVY